MSSAELTWLGHGSFSLATESQTVLIDPFLNDSPTAPVRAEEVTPEFILVFDTEGGDDLGDDVLDRVHDFVTAQRLQRIVGVQPRVAAQELVERFWKQEEH